MATKLLDRLHKLWELTGGEFQGVVTDQPAPQAKEPFVTFPCAECEFGIAIEQFILPGDAAVVNCPSCNTSMTVYSPSLIIRKTKELPKGIQDKVWGELSA